MRRQFARMHVSRILAKSTKWWRCGRHSLPSYISLIQDGNVGENIIVICWHLSYYLMPFFQSTFLAHITIIS